MYIYHALINALSAHMIHINLNMIFYTHVEHSPTKTIYIKYYKKLKTKRTTHTQIRQADSFFPSTHPCWYIILSIKHCVFSCGQKPTP